MQHFRVIRLLSVANVFAFRKFIKESLDELAEKYGLSPDFDATEKTMHWMVQDHDRVWFAVVIDMNNTPVAFALAHDATPPFEDRSIWAVRWFYHAPGAFDATLFLKKEFETFAKALNIGSYLVTTNRLSGGAIRCFQQEKFGFKKAFLTFEKKL